MVEPGVAATRLSELATRVAGGLLVACATAAALTGCSIRSMTFTPEETPPPEAGIPDPAQPIDGGLPDTGNPAMATVTISREGAASGAVSAEGLALSCAETCKAVVPVGTVVTLMASPELGAVFGGWTGGCSGTDAICRLTVAADVAVAARFDVATFAVELGLIGDGSGAITSIPAGLDCPAACAMTVPYRTMVELLASPSQGSTFLGWSGACTGTGRCVVTVTAATSVSATFAANNSLIVVRAGSGTGSVSSSPAGIDCGTDCVERFPPGTVVTLSAAATADSAFTGWTGGGCSGTGICVVTINDDTTVTASFALRWFDLVVTSAGNGSGAVSSSPAGINCGSGCQTYDAHTQVTLTASPAADSTFTGWAGGGCSGTGTCQITMNAAAQVTATFALRRFDLVVTRAGNGSGAVSSSPAGINCGSGCQTYDAHTQVTLTASPAADSTFTGWTGGGCSGTSTCQITMNAATQVTAGFALRRFDLVVARAGNGSGAVTSSPAGIDCGTDCSETYDTGTVVTLTATAAAGSKFTGWSGACAGTGTCQVTLTNTTSVTATFTLLTRLLLVANASPPSVAVFDAGASGNAAPLRVISGPATTFVVPSAVAVANDEIFVVDESIGVIDVFPLTANGNVAPSRQITGVSTNFSSSIAVFGNEIFVGGDAFTVEVFPQSASGNTTPSRILFGPVEVTGVAVADGELFTVDTDVRQISAYPINASDSTPPNRTITFNDQFDGFGIAVQGGEILVSANDIDTLQHPQIRVYPQAGSGQVQPLRIITGGNTRLNVPMGIVSFAGEIYVANRGSNSVLVFPIGGNGDLVPTRQLLDLGVPLSVFVIEF